MTGNAAHSPASAGCRDPRVPAAQQLTLYRARTDDVASPYLARVTQTCGVGVGHVGAGVARIADNWQE
jgi:hypothetical protein